MNYALALSTGGECGDPRIVVDLAVRAEAAGWDGVFLEDYVVYQGDARAPTCPSWPTLAAIAVRTERITLGTAVTPLTRRRPWNVAREAAAVDQLSGGRVVLGVGLGDVGDSVLSDASYTRFGEEMDPQRRGEMLDEALEILAAAWTGEPVSFRGKHFVVDDVAFLPRPVQEPRIPIWVGGGYPKRRPLERALRWDGTCLYREDGGDMTPNDVRTLRERAGERPWTICVGGRARADDWNAEREHIRAVRDAGADWWAEWVPAGDLETMRTGVERGALRAD